MRRLRFTLPAITAAAIGLAAPAGASAAPGCAGANIVPNAHNAPAVRHATLCLLNRERARHGLPRLRAQRSLRRAATSYVRSMVHNGFFGHVSPGGSTMVARIRRTAYLRHARGWALGENLAWGPGGAATPAQIVNAWMHSPGHRANILNPHYREIGIGVVRGARGRRSPRRRTRPSSAAAASAQRAQR
jgi:uncharacterized protein YkwD